MRRHRYGHQQHGVVLAIALVWLLIATLLVISSVQSALQEHKAARAFRDRAIAFQAAEAGLIDAETDLDASPSPALSRSAMFAADRSEGFPQDGEELCQSGKANQFQGLCRAAQGNALLSMLAEDSVYDAASLSVEYGHFTGRTLQTGGGMLPIRLPRYVIELVRDRSIDVDTSFYLYRITAIGFGPHAETQVVLQSFYRKALAT
jgi:Tfp pilus assembly protein PilX